MISLPRYVHGDGDVRRDGHDALVGNAREGLTDYTSIFADRHTACPCEGRNVRELRRELVLITERRYCEDIRNPEDRSKRRDDDPTARVRHAQRAAGPQVN